MFFMAYYFGGLFIESRDRNVPAGSKGKIKRIALTLPSGA